MQNLKLRSQWKDFGFFFVCLFMLDQLEMKREKVVSEESIQKNIYI